MAEGIVAGRRPGFYRPELDVLRFGAFLLVFIHHGFPLTAAEYSGWGIPPTLATLFASGARRVLSSIWTVDDRATTMLMDRFYENLARGAAPPGALHEAKVYVRTLKDASGRRPFEHPAYWAGFLLVGLP